MSLSRDEMLARLQALVDADFERVVYYLHFLLKAASLAGEDVESAPGIPG